MREIPSTSQTRTYRSPISLNLPSTSRANNHKRRLSFDSSSSDELEDGEKTFDGNATLMTLRTKKVKLSPFSEQQMEDLVRKAIGNVKERGEAEKLKTKTGKISTVAIVNEFPGELRNVSVKKLRTIIAKLCRTVTYIDLS